MRVGRVGGDEAEADCGKRRDLLSFGVELVEGYGIGAVQDEI